MSWSERLEEAQGSMIAAAAAAIVSGSVWLVRRILTNQKQIELLQREIAMRDERRRDDRQFIESSFDDVKSGMNEMREDIRTLFNRKD
jgi:hypothetical protein